MISGVFKELFRALQTVITWVVILIAGIFAGSHWAADAFLLGLGIAVTGGAP